jgi:predicted outer membrane protein
MKSILGLIIVLIIGFLIGSFTNKGEGMFSFLSSGMFTKDSTVNLLKTDELTKNAQDALSKVTQAAQKETGAVFDKKYLDAMITAYETSIALSKVATVASGQNEIRTLAKGVSKDDQAILLELKKMRSTYFPETPTSSSTNPTTKPPFVK